MGNSCSQRDSTHKIFTYDEDWFSNLFISFAGICGTLIHKSNKINDVFTAKSTWVAENVKFPNLGTATPLPFLSYLAIYEPRISYIKKFQLTRLAVLG